MAHWTFGRIATPAVSVALIALACADVRLALPDLIRAAPAPPTVGFGGPTLNLPPANSDGSPSSRRTENLPIAVRLSADRQRIAELDWALLSACNFDARADWGRVTDIPIAPDGTFASITTDVSGRGGNLRGAGGPPGGPWRPPSVVIGPQWSPGASGA